MGWLPDRPDFRDYSPPEKIIEHCKNKERIRLEKAISPDRRLQHVDLREWCSPIQEQGNLKSCTAIAGVALVEYFERKVKGEYIDASSLFLYKVARKLMKLTGDTGVSTRNESNGTLWHTSRGILAL